MKSQLRIYLVTVTATATVIVAVTEMIRETEVRLRNLQTIGWS